MIKDILALWAWILALATAAMAVVFIAMYPSRIAAIFHEETRTQVYETSRSYQQGAQLNISRLCREMRTGDAEHARATAALIRMEASTYAGPRSRDIQDCITEAERN